MKIFKAYKFKLKTKRKLANQLQIFAGHTRFVWNKDLDLNLHRLKNKMPTMYYKERLSQTIQQRLKDLEKAFRDCFDKAAQP